MFAQAYFTDDPKTIRLFKTRSSTMIAELPLEESNLKSANKSLKNIKLKAKNWVKAEWGFESIVFFK